MSSDSYEARYFTADDWNRKKAQDAVDYVQVELEHGRPSEELELWLGLALVRGVLLIARELEDG